MWVCDCFEFVCDWGDQRNESGLGIEDKELRHRKIFKVASGETSLLNVGGRGDKEGGGGCESEEFLLMMIYSWLFLKYGFGGVACKI